MATRKRIKTVSAPVEEVAMPVMEEKKTTKMNFGWLLVLAIAVGGLFWMYKSNNFPISAVVGMKPVWRHQVNQNLYKQGGKAEVDNEVTELLVKDELSREGIKVTDAEVTSKIESIKASLGAGQDLNTLLAARGMTMDDVKRQLVLQMGIEKALASKVSVSDDEVATYIKSNGSFLSATTEAAKKDEAMAALKQQKMQTSVSTWIEDLRSKAKIWYAEKQ